MKSNLLTLLIALCIITMMATLLWLPGEVRWIVYVAGVMALAVLGWLLYSVIMPKNVAMRGMELISAQDFNNRLVKTGEHDADKIVKLFNTMIDRLRNERLRKQEQENLMLQIIEASPMGVVMLDFDGKISMANPAFFRLTGIADLNDIIGKAPAELKNPLVKEMITVATGSNSVVRDGDIRTYRCYHLNFLQLGFHREFFLLESLTEEVMKAERAAYEKVIRTISHEVNNTMGGVRTVLDIISDANEDSDMAPVIESCGTRCDMMCDFVSSYADVVRVPEPVLTEVDLCREMERLVPFVRMMVSGNVMFEFVRPEQTVMAMIDSALMQQVIVNIIKNANESIHGKEGKIVLSVGVAGEHPEIVISNTGEPISEEVSRQLFRPFFTTKKNGRGIGLTLTAEILGRHGARFSLRTGEDGITRFNIIF